MAISTDFNYDDMLSLDKVFLVGRSRTNFLGTKELTINYNGITSAMREDAVEWLETNGRGVDAPLIDPTFGFKTYEGSWYCVDISFNEQTNVIQQRLKIDSSLVDDPSTRTSEGTLSERSYYWKIVDPTSITLPLAENIDDGDTYTKTANDNGDGTYDVVISKNINPNFTGSGFIDGYTNDLSASISDSDYVDGTYGSPDGDYPFMGYTRWYGRDEPTWTSPFEFVNFHENGQTVNGQPVLVDGKGLWAIWYYDGATDYYVITDISDLDGPLPTNYWRKPELDDFTGEYDGQGTYSGDNQDINRVDGTPWWERDDGSFSITCDTFSYITTPIDTYNIRAYNSSVVIYDNESGLCPSKWDTGTDLVKIQIGCNPASYSETEETFSGSVELEFNKDGGTVPDPVAGEKKSISNVPNGDGTFKTTVVTKTANRQRSPANFGFHEYTSKYQTSTGGVYGQNAILSAKNSTESDLATDSKFIDDRFLGYTNSISTTISESGLIDYSITSYFTGIPV